MEEKLKKEGNGGPYSERKKLKNIIEDKTQQIESLKAEADTLQDQLSYAKKEVSIFLVCDLDFILSKPQ